MCLYVHCSLNTGYYLSKTMNARHVSFVPFVKFRTNRLFRFIHIWKSLSIRFFSRSHMRIRMILKTQRDLSLPLFSSKTKTWLQGHVWRTRICVKVCLVLSHPHTYKVGIKLEWILLYLATKKASLSVSEWLDNEDKVPCPRAHTAAASRFEPGTSRLRVRGSTEPQQLLIKL